MTDVTESARNFRFDWTINLGHILTAGTLVFGGGAALLWSDFRQQALEKAVVRLEAEVSKLGQIVVEQAKIGERLVDHGRRLDRLEAWREGLPGQPKVIPFAPP